MKLFNKTIDRQLFKQYSIGSDLSKQEVVVKIFNPQGAGSWYILNSDPNDPDYLWAIVDLGYGAEVGSVSRSELENYKGRFGLGFERDLSFDSINAEELYKGLINGKYYADGGKVSKKETEVLGYVKSNGDLYYFSSRSRGLDDLMMYEKIDVIQLNDYDGGKDFFLGYGSKSRVNGITEKKSDGRLFFGKWNKGFVYNENYQKYNMLGRHKIKYADGGGIERNINGLNSLGEKIKDDKGLFYWKSDKDGKIRLTSGNGTVYFLEFNTLTEAEAYVKKVNANTPNFFSSTYANGGLITEEKLKEEEWFSPDMKIMYKYKNGRLGITLFYGKNRRYSKTTVINDASELSIKELNSRVKEEISELKKFAKEILENNFEQGGEVSFIQYKDSEIMYEPHYNKYYANDVEFDSLKEAQQFIDSGNIDDNIRDAYSRGIFADGGDIESFTDNQQMIMNQNIELEHHHEELEDILEDEMPVPAWVVAKMATAIQSVSDVTHYLDGQKELMEDKNEDEENEEEDDQDEIENKIVVEPINVSAGTKAELTKKFTDDAFGNLKGFLKGMEGIDLRDDYTFDYKNEQFEIEPIINSDENGVFNAVFTIFDGDGEDVGDVAYSREGGKQKFTANSEFFIWNNAKFEDGGFINNVYADGGYFDGTIPKASTYMTNYAKGGEIAKAEILGLSRNIMGTTDIEMKITGMRKPQDFIVYPIGKDDAGNVITIQSDTRIGQINLVKGFGVMSQSHSSGAYFIHLQMDKLTSFTLSENDLQELKAHIFKTAGSSVGTRNIVSDNAGASKIYGDGGSVKRTRRTNDEIRKDQYNKEVDLYNWYVINISEKRAESGFEYKEDAVDLLSDYDGDKNFKVVSKKALKNLGIEIPNESWKYAEGGGIGFIPMALEQDLSYTAKWGGTDIKGVLGILNAMIDSGLTDNDLKPKPAKSGTAHQNAIEKKANEIWTKIQPQYKGDLKGNMPYGTIRRLVDRANFPDEILKRFKPFRKNQKKSFAKGRGLEKVRWQDVEKGDSARVKELNRMGLITNAYGRKFNLKFPNGTEKTFDASELDFFKLEKDQYEIDNDNNYANGGINLNNGSKYDGYNLKDINGKKIEVGDTVKTTQPSGGLLNPANSEIGIVEKTKDAFGNNGLQIKYRKQNDNFDRFILLNGKINEIIEKADSFSKLTNYILKADIKTVTVKRNGKELIYKASDVLNGANVLSKGGDLTSKANYVPKRNVIEVELKDGSKVKPVNGYWIKKDAEPIGTESKDTSLPKSETKIDITQIRKDSRGNWRAETNIDNFNGYDWRISTVKTYSGNLVSSAQGGKTEPTGTKGYNIFKYTMYQDPNHTLEVSKPKRLTDKVVSEQHDKALAKFKKFMETGMFKSGGKISNFDKLSSKVAKEYEGQSVKSQYQEEYGKYYSKEEAQEVGDKVAGKVKAMQSDKKAFGGLFGSAKNKLMPKNYANLDDKMVFTKDGRAFQVVDQTEDTLLVIDPNKMGSGVRPHKINISEIDPTSYKLGGKTTSKKVNSGTETLKQANELAKKIRKDGETWLDAKKRAFAQLKK